MRVRVVPRSRLQATVGTAVLALVCANATNGTASAASDGKPGLASVTTARVQSGASFANVATAYEASAAAAASVGPATARGIIKRPDGTAAANTPVTIVDVDGAGSTRESPLPLVGTAVTNSAGAWSLTLPNPLPAKLAALSGANGGVLNLRAQAMGIAATGAPFTAIDNIAVGAASGIAATPLSAAVRADAAAHTVALSSARLIAAAGVTATPAEPASIVVPFDNPCTISSQVLSSTIAYTVVGEAHAYYDATANFYYESTLSSSFGIEVSVDGTHWSLSGSVTLGSSTSVQTGTGPEGPHWGHQFQVPIKYEKKKYHTHCLHGGDTYSYNVVAAGYSVPAGGAVARIGNDVSGNDGAAKFSASNPAYRAVVPRTLYYQISKNKSITYGAAASAFGLRISAQTTYTSTHAQRLTAGRGTLSHDIWGATGPITNPGVFYSY